MQSNEVEDDPLKCFDFDIKNVNPPRNAGTLKTMCAKLISSIP